MSFLTVDIETVPQARFTAPGQFNVRDDFEPTDDALSGLLRGEAPVQETGVPAALHATTCEIVQVSFGWRQGDQVETRLCQRDGYGSEAELLVDALYIIAKATGKGTTLVSFNGKQFDVPVLRARAAVLRLAPIPIPWRRLLYPYADDRHADLRLILGADDRRARGTLQWWADCLGIYAEEHGADVFAWVCAGEWDKLSAYGRCEACTLVELFERVAPVL